MAIHKCKRCGKSFKSGRAFEDHKCNIDVKALSLEELRALINNSKQEK